MGDDLGGGRRDGDHDRDRVSVHLLARPLRARGALQRLLLVLVILPFWTSYLLRVYSWLNILGDQGAINRFLQWTRTSPTSRSRSSSTTGRR